MSFPKEMSLRIKHETWKAWRLHTILLWNTREDALTAQPALEHYCMCAMQPVCNPTAQLQSQGPFPWAHSWLLALTPLAPTLTLFLESQSQGLSRHSTQHRGTMTAHWMENRIWSLLALTETIKTSDKMCVHLYRNHGEGREMQCYPAMSAQKSISTNFLGTIWVKN